MEIIFTVKIDDILQTGRWLGGIGVHNWALSKSEALAAIEELRMLKYPLFGGDVYRNVNGVFQLSYDNWSCSRLKSETSVIYIERSLDEGKRYIEQYKNREVEETFFALVPGESVHHKQSKSK